jgi:hypothetical protein
LEELCPGGVLALGPKSSSQPIHRSRRYLNDDEEDDFDDDEEDDY